MSTFIYEGFRTGTGRPAAGQLEAEDDRGARLELRRQGVMLTKLEQRRAGLLQRLATSDIQLTGSRVRPGDVAWFARNLGGFIRTGIPLSRALSLLAAQRRGKPIGRILEDMLHQVSEGRSLSKAAESHVEALGTLTVSLMEAGEKAGRLPDTLDQLADVMEARVRLRAAVAEALTYPALVLGLVGVVVALLMVFAIPTFKTLYEEIGGTLPLTTRVLLGISDLTIFLLPFSPLIAAGAFFAWRAVRSNEDMRRRIDRWVLRAPLFGGLLRSSAVARSAKVLSAGVSAGVPILECLRLAGAAASNRAIEGAFREAAGYVEREGGTVSAGLAGTDESVVPEVFVQVVAIGEESTSLDTRLAQFAEMTEREVQSMVTRLTTLMSSCLVIPVGLILGGVFLAMYQPILNATNMLE